MFKLREPKPEKISKYEEEALIYCYSEVMAGYLGYIYKNDS